MSMSPEQVKLQIKSTALNKINKLYSSEGYRGDEFDRDSSWGEQRDSDVGDILHQMRRDLKELKHDAI